MARPLLKETKGGAPYTRSKSVEANIDAALGLDAPSLIARASVASCADLDYLPSECLVHLIRHALREDDEHTANALLRSLLQRCEANLIKTVPDTRIPHAVEVRENILSDFSMMFADDTVSSDDTALDFYECRFNRAFRALRISHIRQARSARKEDVRMPQKSNEEGVTLDEEVLARLSRTARHDPTQEDHAYLPEVLEAVNALPPDLRQAVVLCRIIGYDEESDDQLKRTAATICGCTGRTIRNRLARADKLLKDLLKI